jgi:DNA-binding GntR family transcriptional regulator
MTAADELFMLIVADILSGILRPKDPLTERALVERFGVSRTPVREALKRLWERGFLSVGRTGVAVVRDASREELRDLFALRIRLEKDAAILLTGRITPAEIEQLRQTNARFAKAVAKRDLNQIIQLRGTFHSLAVSAVGNRWFAEILMDLRDKCYPAGPWHWQDGVSLEDMIRTHDQMIEALALHDAHGYAALVVGQIQSALDAYLGRLQAIPAVCRRSRAKPRPRSTGGRT